ncbi:MAG: M20/M25/M40 family metallo-hydrolase, partial [Gemmatimonadaceae bacterium]
EREALPEVHQIWIDIGAKNRKDALKRVRLGDPAVYDVGFELLHGSVGAARAFDNKAGCYVVCETLRRLAERRKKLQAKVVAVATTQEEIGYRGGGAGVCATCIGPQMAIVVDVTFATDHPDIEKKELGDHALGSGPVLTRGSIISPVVFRLLRATADDLKVPYTVQAAGRNTGTDADAIHIAREGIATALVSVPNRYMHSPNEMIALDDLDRTITLIAESCRRVTGETDFTAR